MDEHEEPIAERAAKGAFQGWLAAKSVRWTVRLTMLAVPFLLVVAYGAVAWVRARRALLLGALDDDALATGEPPPSLVARETGVTGWVRG